MIDSLIANLPQARRSDVLARLGVQAGRYVFVTLHRPANVDQREALAPIMEGLLALAGRLPVVFPIHPRTRKMLDVHGINVADTPGLKLVDPVGYHDSLNLTENARLVLTDSGGLQEEATYFRTPCLTLRPNTERPVTISLGSNRLTQPNRLKADIDAVLALGPRLGQNPPLWDGQTAGRILAALQGFC